MGKSQGGRRRFLRLAMLLLLVGGIMQFSPGASRPAAAFWTDGRWPVESVSYDASAIANCCGAVGVDSIHRMDWEWEDEALIKWTDFYECGGCNGGVNRRMFFQNMDGYQFGLLAEVDHIGCTATQSCWMRFDSTERWNTTSEQRDANWCDLQSVALHEFGHWIGLSHSYDIPTTDARTAVMRGEQYSDLGYGVIKRDIRQDDVNGFHAARNYATILTADDSMEYYGTWHFKFHQRVAGVGSRSLYCDGSGYAGTRCFIEYNGSGNSLYQDISPRGNYVNFRTMVARARFRNRTGQPASVTVAVWNLDNGQVVAQQVCNLPLDSSWVQCATPGFSTGGNNLRQEVYNNTGGNVDIDTFILG